LPKVILLFSCQHAIQYRSLGPHSTSRFRTISSKQLDTLPSN
jgi:hypothetical protein